jgi:hypothetical protein
MEIGGQHYLRVPYAYAEYEFKCPNCVYQFRTHEDLIHHFSHDEYHAFNAGLWKLKHPNYTETPIFCFRCSKVVKNLLHHWGFTAKHHVCWACGLDYSTAEDLAEHVRGRGVSGRSHLGNYLRFNLEHCYNCKVCYMIFPSLSTRRRHESEDLIHCDRKILKYASSVCYDPSLLTVTDRSGWMYCHRCKVVLSEKGPSHDTLVIWKNHKDTSTNHNYCLDCRLDFPKDKALELHISKFHPLDFACPRANCRRVYKTLEKMQTHCAEKTGLVYPWDEHVDFQCDCCQKILGTLDAWQEHMKSDAFHLHILQGYDDTSLQKSTGNLKPFGSKE